MQLPGSCLLSDPVTVGDRLDLRWVQREEIVSIEDTKFVSISKPGNFHGLALWFDVSFEPPMYGEETDIPFKPLEGLGRLPTNDQLDPEADMTSVEIMCLPS